jgi:methyl-accepting chemotaxis protein
VEQIAKAIIQVEKVTQTSAATAEETASAGEELSAQSASLRETVGHLEALVGVEDGQ